MAELYLHLTLPGEPVGKSAGRTVQNRHSGKRHTFIPAKSRDYMNLVKLQFRSTFPTFQLLVKQPVAVAVCLYVAPPASASKRKRTAMLNGAIRPTVKPDVDNVAKAILDGLTGVAFQDDKAVVELHLWKWYSATPHTEIYLYAPGRELPPALRELLT